MVEALLIGLALWAAAAFAFWALCRQAGRLDDAEGRGDG
jgi:hypothetical protein